MTTAQKTHFNGIHLNEKQAKMLINPDNPEITHRGETISSIADESSSYFLVKVKGEDDFEELPIVVGEDK